MTYIISVLGRVTPCAGALVIITLLDVLWDIQRSPHVFHVVPCHFDSLREPYRWCWEPPAGLGSARCWWTRCGSFGPGGGRSHVESRGGLVSRSFGRHLLAPLGQVPVIFALNKIDLPEPGGLCRADVRRGRRTFRFRRDEKEEMGHHVKGR